MKIFPFSCTGFGVVEQPTNQMTEATRIELMSRQLSFMWCDLNLFPQVMTD
jgi:hypothetical protein